MVMCVVCKKVIHGAMDAALLACKKLVKLRKQWGLVVKLHDPCVWNVGMDNSHFSMDSLPMSPRDPVLARTMAKRR